MTMMITEPRSTAFVPEFEEDRITCRSSSLPLHTEPERVSYLLTDHLINGARLPNSESDRGEVVLELEHSKRELATRNDNISVCQSVHELLSRSGYPLAKVQCHCFDRSLELSGSVSQYYHLQVALEIAKQSAGGRQLDIQVQVQSQPTPTTGSRPPVL